MKPFRPAKRNHRRILPALLISGTLICILTGGEAFAAHSSRSRAPAVRKHSSRHYPTSRYPRTYSSRSYSGFSSGCGSTTQSVWVPGRYEYQQQQVVIKPGHYQIHQMPAIYETRKLPDGKEVLVQLQPARTEKIWVPEETGYRQVKVWIPGYYVQTSSYPSRSRKGVSFSFRF